MRGWWGGGGGGEVPWCLSFNKALKVGPVLGDTKPRVTSVWPNTAIFHHFVGMGGEHRRAILAATDKSFTFAACGRTYLVWPSGSVLLVFNES